MNRLSPLVARRPRTAAMAYAAPRAAASPPAASDDLRMFATTFLGGLAFFGTYLA